MLWAISAISKPDMDAVRDRVRPAHNEYLSGRKDIVVLVCPMKTDDDAQIIGSLRIVNVKSRAEAQAFFDGDPLAQAGAFASVTITRLKKGHWHPDVAENE